MALNKETGVLTRPLKLRTSCQSPSDLLRPIEHWTTRQGLVGWSMRNSTQVNVRGLGEVCTYYTEPFNTRMDQYNCTMSACVGQQNSFVL